ncbi:hypothetical protein acdb102_21130 [Acidothermaceae bacterium B102]|nr:hypothetical protein acdb102_21130 [Acidothermaceae bacterium B102]
MTSATGVVLAVDTTVTTLAEIEHVLLDLGEQVALPDDAYLCTHMMRDDRPHYVVSLTSADEASLDAVRQHLTEWDSAVSHGEPVNGAGIRAGLRMGVREALTRDGGRAVRFPGWDSVRGSLPVGEVLAATPIGRLEVLGGGTAALTDILHSRGFVRPLWRSGELVLPVLPSGPGAVAPFEVPNPTPCCGEHTEPQR